MTEPTALDRAHAAMEAEAGGDGARLAYHEQLAAAELHLLLERAPDGDRIAPRLFELTDGPVALVFDSPERLVAFAEGPAHHAILPGRTLAAMLAGQGIGIGLNLGVAPSQYLLSPEGVDWLAGMTGRRAETVEGRPVALRPPPDLPAALIEALDRRLARMAGLAGEAWLAEAEWPDGRRGALLAIVGAVPGAEPALAGAVAEAVAFSGLEEGAVDLMLVAAGAPILAPLARVGLRFDLPERERPAAPVAPGADPERPPRLR